MNILLINHYAGSPELGMEFRPYYMAKEWVKAGHQVLIVGGSFSHLRKVQPQGKEDLIEGIHYRWVKLNAYKGNGIGRIRSMFSFVSKLWWGYKKYIGDSEPNVVIASSTYPLDIYPAYRIAKHFKAKLVFEIHDLWPLSPMLLGGYSKYHPFIVALQVAENYAYKHCDKCISILPNVRAHVLKHGLAINKLYIVPNGFDEEEWRKGIELLPEMQNFFYNLKRENKQILGYIGGHALSNALDVLIDAMALIKNKDIVAVFVGKGNEKEKLMNDANKQGLNNVYFLDPVDKRMVPSLLKEMDVLYLGGKNQPLYQYGTSQTKLFDYMQAAKPVIQTISPPNNYVAEAQCGITIVGDGALAVANGIEKMMNYSKQELGEMGMRGKLYCNSHFNYRKLSFDFMKYINE